MSTAYYRWGSVVTLLIVIGLLVIACGPTAEPAAPETAAPDAAGVGLESELVINAAGGSFGDAVRTAFAIPFEGDTGVKVIYDAGNDQQGARLLAQETAGEVQWDVLAGFDYSYYQDLYDKGLLADIDYSKIGDVENQVVADSLLNWGLGFQYDGWGLGYNSEAYPTPPTKLADFFDVENFPGDRMIQNWGQPEINIIAALLADGVPPEELFPFDYERAFRMLDKVKPSITVFFESGNQAVSALVDGRAVMTLCIDGRVLQASQLNPAIKMVWEGGWRYVSYWVIPKNAPHPEAAHAFLKSTLEPSRQATFTSITGYSGIVPEAYKLLTEDRQESVLLNPENFAKTFEITVEDLKWLGENRDDLNQRWNEWISQ